MLRTAFAQMLSLYNAEAANSGADDPKAEAVALSNVDAARRMVAREASIVRDSIALLDKRIEQVEELPSPAVEN